jgi:Amt family ammonium transporter
MTGRVFGTTRASRGRLTAALTIGLILGGSAVAWAQAPAPAAPAPTLNSGDTAWMLISTALVLLMTPALAFFYGGLVRSKNALNTMMMSFISLGFVGVAWAVIGYSLAFTPGNNWIGDMSRASCAASGCEAAGTDPARLLHVLPGHVLHHHGGADLGRHRRAHAVLRLRRVHHAVGARRLRPIAHWVWGGGWLAKHGRARLRGRHRRARQRRRRGARGRDLRRRAARQPVASLIPHNVPFVLLGAGLLWFGWFGFNAGSALAASAFGGLAFTTTMLAPAGTLVVWTILDCDATGSATAVGARTGIVVGLVAVTPAPGSSRR